MYLTTSERRREALVGGFKAAFALSDHAQLLYLMADPESKRATYDTAIDLAEWVDRGMFALDRLAEGICHG